MNLNKSISSSKINSVWIYIIMWLAVFLIFLMFGITELKKVQTYRSLSLLRHCSIPVSCQANPEFDGKIIHIDCPLRNLHTFYPPYEFRKNVPPFKGVFYEMIIEMYQWKYNFLFIFPRLKGVWSTSVIDSNSFPFFLRTSYRNPGFIPLINGAGRRFASELYGGSYRLVKKHLVNFRNKQQLTLTNDGRYSPLNEYPPTSFSHANTQVYDNALYTGNPHWPKVGDLRITFWGSTATHVSAIGQQRNGVFITDLIKYSPLENTLKKANNNHYEKRNTLDNHTYPTVRKNTEVTELIYEGDYSSEQMFNKYIYENSGSLFLLWINRFLFYIILTITILWSYKLSMNNHIDTYSVFSSPYIIISAMLLSLGGMFLIMSMFWVGIYLSKSIRYFLISLFSFLLVGVAWKYATKNLSKNTTDQYNVDMIPIQNDRIEYLSPIQQGSTSKHFYQPV